MSKDTGFFGSLGLIIDAYWPNIGNIIAVFILAFSTSLITTPEQFFDFGRIATWLEWFGIASFFVSSLILTKNSTRTAQLEAESQQLRELIKNLGNDIQDKWRLVLIPIFEKLELDNNCRISIYLYENPSFIMLGRFSPDPQKQKTGRGYYPADKGCIGEAHKNKEAFADLPDTNTAEYYEIMSEQWQIDASIVQAFSMKPRSIAAFAIEERRTYRRPMVIVFESTASNAFDREVMRNTCNSYNKMLCDLWKDSEAVLPSLHYAKERGF